jgi:type II secretion system protein J
MRPLPREVRREEYVVLYPTDETTKRSGMQLRSCRGFTLIEILVAVAVLALLVGLIQGIYLGVARSRVSAETQTAAVHAASSTLQRLADELAMAFFSKSRPEQTVFKGLSDAQHLSSLEFASRVPTIAGIRTGGDVRLSYELVRDSGAQDDRVYVLRRTELADFRGNPDRDGIVYDMLSGVRSFTVEYFDGDKWVEDWDSDTNVANNAQPLPKAVRIEVAWGKEGALDVLRTASPIYGETQ